MKYIKTKNGNIYKVILENEGCGKGHYVCSTLYSYDMIVKSGEMEKRINDCHDVAFIDQDAVIKEAETIDELLDI